jgi:hypothetical protein
MEEDSSMTNQGRLIKTITIILLLFLAVFAFLGGGAFIHDPSGAILQIPLSFLDHSPFSSFLLPGILLFTVFGLGGLACALLLIFKFRQAGDVVIVAGAALVIWIVVQLAMIRTFHYLHAIYGVLGLVLLFLGFRLRRNS